MEWSNKLPVDPGWYFLKVAKAGKPVRIVYVSKVPAGKIGAGELVYAANPGAATVFLRDLPDSLLSFVWWGGPIPEPTVPDVEVAGR